MGGTQYDALDTANTAAKLTNPLAALLCSGFVNYSFYCQTCQKKILILV